MASRDSMAGVEAVVTAGRWLRHTELSARYGQDVRLQVVGLDDDGTAICDVYKDGERQPRQTRLSNARLGVATGAKGFPICDPVVPDPIPDVPAGPGVVVIGGDDPQGLADHLRRGGLNVEVRDDVPDAPGLPVPAPQPDGPRIVKIPMADLLPEGCEVPSLDVLRANMVDGWTTAKVNNLPGLVLPQVGGSGYLAAVVPTPWGGGWEPFLVTPDGKLRNPCSVRPWWPAKTVQPPRAYKTAAEARQGARAALDARLRRQG